MQPEKTVSLKIGDKKYSIVSDDAYLDGVGKDFEPGMVRLFRSLIAPSHVVVDVGANIGLTSLLFGELATRVISFEASPSTCRFLERNVAASGLGNIEIINKALGSEDMTSEITFAPNNRSGGFVSNKTKASAGHVVEEIEIRRLDGLSAELSLDKLDFVKIDVEGHEKFVIEGGGKIIARHRPVVVLELNHWCLNAFQRITVPDFFDFLRATFPIVLAIQDDHYLDLFDQSQSYTAMYRHIVQWQYSNLVCAFDEVRLKNFREIFRND